MTAILGIDAAWTGHNPSGLALVSNASGTWRSVATAPSYRAFVDHAGGTPIGWLAPKIEGSVPDVPELLAAARQLLEGAAVDIVTVDMPMARAPISSRRVADEKISRAFGAAWCGAHSPSDNRPGKLGRDMTAAFEACGYALTVDAVSTPPTRALLEVYPHPALLTLMQSARRLEYKIGKPDRDVATVRRLWTEILARLGAEIAGINVPIPAGLSKAQMKRYEDALDALICAWVGIHYVTGRAVAHGDATAAIWVPMNTAAAPAAATATP